MPQSGYENSAVSTWCPRDAHSSSTPTTNATSGCWQLPTYFLILLFLMFLLHRDFLIFLLHRDFLIYMLHRDFLIFLLQMDFMVFLLHVS
jgi:hypothetical protein